MKILRTMLVASMICLVFGCSSKQPKPETLIGLGYTFRDLRQNTYSDTEDVYYGQPCISPDGKRLAFVVKKGGNEDIYVKSPDSKTMTRMTFSKTADIHPAFSPDGEKIAFASERNGNYDIFVMNTKGGKAKTQLTFTEDHEISPTWSHDGKRLAFCRYNPLDQYWSIWVMDLATEAITAIAPGKFPKYSPVDNFIAFERPNEEKNRHSSIWIINDHGDEETMIMSSTEESYRTPDWSPDGTKIVFSSQGKEVPTAKIVMKASHGDEDAYYDVFGKRGNDIWVIERDATALTQLTGHKAIDCSPSWKWSPDNRLYFTSLRDGYTNIWSIVPRIVKF